MFEYKEISNSVCVIVRPDYCENKSHILSHKFVFTYQVTIENQGKHSIQLLRRSWLIKDSAGDMYEVNGEGVIGKQPLIEPGNSFTYQSFCVLKSQIGSMEGFYEMKTEQNELLRISIPRFYLRSHLMN